MDWKRGLEESNGRSKAWSTVKFGAVPREFSLRGKTEFCKWSATGLRATLRNLQKNAGGNMKIIYVIPRPVWPVGLQLQSASRYWMVTHRDGIRKKGWVSVKDF